MGFRVYSCSMGVIEEYVIVMHLEVYKVFIST